MRLLVIEGMRLFGTELCLKEIGYGDEESVEATAIESERRGYAGERPGDGGRQGDWLGVALDGNAPVPADSDPRAGRRTVRRDQRPQYCLGAARRLSRVLHAGGF